MTLRRMRALLAFAAFAFLAAGCVVHVPVAAHGSGATAQRCPPGHQWSDGRCHAKGKGHDPAKHER